ncbi:helix-turn-helix domain-containing protein [Paenibacillus sp. OV219]|uniref:helix-turn-helix domain-containing protein n=1 Tax=Paenibacillus sp. OV219 TaxID=1884377 RepID=UPI0008D504EB|nr:helix-turn-helix transcriptional regulator [Paenibacillus sp. OV219]SEP17455.1 Helix-turn-helix [Paenibacillus sp. OV219]
MLTAEAIRAIRKVRRISQSELAQQTGIPQPYISKMETGGRIITAEEEAALITAFSISAELAAELTQLARHANDAKRLEAVAWSKLRDKLAVESV